MPEELKQALTEFAKRMLDVANSGMDQLPAVLHDVVGAAILSATIWWWASLVVMTLGVLLIVLCFWQADAFPDGGPALVGACLVTIGGISLTFNWYNYYYAVHFPNLVILEYLRRLS